MFIDLLAAFSHLSPDQLVALTALAALGVAALALRIVWIALRANKP